MRSVQKLIAYVAIVVGAALAPSSSPVLAEAEPEAEAVVKTVTLPKEFVRGEEKTLSTMDPPPAAKPDVLKVADIEVGKSCYVEWRDKTTDGIAADESWRAWLRSRTPGYSKLPRPKAGSEFLKATRTGVRKILVDIDEMSVCWSNQYTDKNLIGVFWKGPSEDQIGTDVFEVEFVLASKPGQVFKTVPPKCRAERIWSLKVSDEGWISLGNIHTDADGIGWIDGNCSVRREKFTDVFGQSVRIGIGGDNGNCAWVDLEGVSYKWLPEKRPISLNAPNAAIEPGKGMRYKHLIVWYWQQQPTAAAGRVAADAVQPK